MINNPIITTDNESLQMIVASKNEQVEELQSMLEMKEDRMKELESQLTGKNKILHDSKDIHVYTNNVLASKPCVGTSSCEVWL